MLFGRATVEGITEDLIERGRRRWGPERAEAIRALGANMPTGLALLAEVELGDADEPDFLVAGGA